MEEIIVNLKERSYKVYIGIDILSKLGDILKNINIGQKIVIITNPTINNLYGKLVVNSLNNSGFETFIEEVPDGEKYKTLNWANKLYDRLIFHKMDRNSGIVALGGGVIGDLAGFVAATFMRGLPFIQVPTSLLAQVDSSVGGKVAVNHRLGKNLIGAFYQPKLVCIDIGVLKTLPKQELIAGLAEVIKYGIIKDKTFFNYLENNITKILSLKPECLFHIVKTSCRIKGKIVEIDEKESGIRAILNYGHTIGHAVETVTNYKIYKHGEAIAIGMSYASKLAHKMKLCSSEVSQKQINLFIKTGLPYQLTNLSPKKIMEALILDKKTLNKKIRFVLTEDIGNANLYEVNKNDLINILTSF